jgi:hypothetical protein
MRGGWVAKLLPSSAAGIGAFGQLERPQMSDSKIEWERKMSQATSMKAVPPAEETKQVMRGEPTTEQIRNRAYEIYVSRRDAPGDELQDWLLAERELLSKQP